VIDAGSSLTANSINLGSLVIGGTDGSPAIVTIAASDANGNPLNVVAASSTSTAHAMAGFQPATPIAASVSAIANASPLTSTTDSSEPPIFGAVAPSSHNSPGSALEVKSNSFDSVGLTALQSSSETGGLSDGTLTASNESERSSSMTTTGLTSTPDGETSLERQSSTISNGMGEFLHRDAVAAVFADADVLEWAALTPASRNPAADADISLMPDEMLAAIGLQWQN
jgi:hypothetical protein